MARTYDVTDLEHASLKCIAENTWEMENDRLTIMTWNVQSETYCEGRENM